MAPGPSLNGSMPPITKPGQFPFPTHNVPDLLAWNPPHAEPIISHGILLPRTRLILYGLYKAWKSMTAMNMAFAIAMGQPWVGYTTQRKTVLYIQYEIPHAELRKRIAKYALAFRQFPENLIFVTPHFLKLDRDYSLPILKQYLGYYHPDVVVIDPIYKALTGDISSSYDVSKFIDNIDLLASEWDFATILIHHERKVQYDGEGSPLPHGSQDMMGSSYFPNWLDTAIQLDRLTDTDVDISFPTMRHAEEELPHIKVRYSHDTLGAHIILGDLHPGLITPNMVFK